MAWTPGGDVGGRNEVADDGGGTANCSRRKSVRSTEMRNVLPLPQAEKGMSMDSPADEHNDVVLAYATEEA